MNIVIPTRPGAQNDSLRWALRCWAYNFPGVEVTVIGGKPSWYKGPHLPTTQRVGAAYQWTENFPRAMRAAVETFDAPFWWTADDIFPLVKHNLLNDPPTWCRKDDLDAYLAKWKAHRAVGYTRSFVAGMTSQRDILRDLGVTTQHNADMHLPHLLDPGHLGELLDLLAKDYPAHPAGHFRAIYGGLWPGRVVRVADPKVAGPSDMKTGTGWASTAHTSWNGRAGRTIRSMFPKPSPWEKR